MRNKISVLKSAFIPMKLGSVLVAVLLLGTSAMAKPKTSSQSHRIQTESCDSCLEPCMTPMHSCFADLFTPIMESCVTGCLNEVGDGCMEGCVTVACKSVRAPPPALVFDDKTEGLQQPIPAGVMAF